MKRGEIWTVRGSSGWIEKARPALIVQNQGFDESGSTVTCLFTTFDAHNLTARVYVEPSKANGLRKPCYVMTDKMVSIRKDEFGSLVGELEQNYLDEVSVQLRAMLGL